MGTPTDSAEIELPSRSVADAHIPVPLCIAACAAQGEEVPLPITDDIPRDLPISMAELEAIETYLADVLDLVLSSG